MGDRASDISMLQLAGIGVAPANADPEVKDAANHITVSCDQDAVGQGREPQEVPGPGRSTIKIFHFPATIRPK